MDPIPLDRPDDLLSAVLDLYNLTLSDDGTRLLRSDPAVPASIVLRLPAQHYLEPVGSTELASPVRPGGESYLDFEVPADVAELAIPATGFFTLLSTLQTIGGHSYVEFPAGLRSFPESAYWDEVSQGGVPARTVWRLSPRLPDGSGTLPMRWQGQFELDPAIGRAVPSNEQWRQMHFRSFRASRYALSSLGATIHMSGPVPLPDGPVDDPIVDSYEHHATFGRDTWVQVTTRGRLSTGHRAALVQTVSRIFVVQWPHGGPFAGAYLDEQRRIVVSDPDVDVSGWAGGYEHGGREMPFRQLHMVTTASDCDVADESRPFWVQFHGVDVQFTMAATDWEGQSVTVASPVLFIPDVSASDTGTAKAIFDVDPLRLRVGVGGQTFALAEPVGREAGSTRTVVQSVVLALQPSLAPAPGLPDLVLSVASANVSLPAVQQFVGRAVTTDVVLHSSYLKSGLTPTENPVGAYLDFVAPLPLEFAPAAVGGLAAVKSSLGAVTAVHGVVASDFALGGAPSVDDLARLFAGTKVLGVVDLKDLIRDGGFSAPTLLTTQLPDSVSLVYHFFSPLKKEVSGILKPGDGAALSLDAKVVRALANPGTGTAVSPLAGDAVNTTVRGELTNISIEIAGIAILNFTSLTFITEPGQKTRIEPVGMDLHFKGALGFLAEIARIADSSGLGKAASVDVSPAGVSAGFAIAIPSIQMGVVHLANLAIDASLVVPFDGRPFRFRLDVASKARPFVATVSMFGGGGYFSMELTSEGLRRLEVAIEFGGSMSLNIIVASGGVYVMAGIYFSYKTVIENGKSREEQVLSAFLRCGGHLSVLGIISVSVEFYLELTYKEIGSQDGLAGRATVTVGVEVLFFSKTVELTVEREFVGSAADPSFAECITPEDWDDYCQAFVGADDPQPALA
jgi:hypothetical protein